MSDAFVIVKNFQKDIFDPKSLGEKKTFRAAEAPLSSSDCCKAQESEKQGCGVRIGRQKGSLGLKAMTKSLPGPSVAL